MRWACCNIQEANKVCRVDKRMTRWNEASQILNCPPLRKVITWLMPAAEQDGRLTFELRHSGLRICNFIVWALHLVQSSSSETVTAPPGVSEIRALLEEASGSEGRSTWNTIRLEALPALCQTFPFVLVKWGRVSCNSRCQEEQLSTCN